MFVTKKCNVILFVVENPGFVVGERVEVNYPGRGRWFPATVIVIPAKNGKDVGIRFDDTVG